MFEELNERRKAVERNIAKGFGMDDADLNFEKAQEDEFEKGRAKKTFAVGDTFTRHGITYKCTGISANTGRPTWSKVKDGEGSKQEQSEKKEDKKEKISQKEVIDFFEKNADKFFEFKSGDLEGTDLEKEFKKYSKFVKLGKTFDASEKEDWEVYKTNKELSGYHVVDAGEGTDAFVALLIKKQQDQPDKKEEKEEQQDCAVEWMEFTLNGGIKKKRKEFDSQDKARSFIDNISKKDSFYQITATSGLDDSKPLYKQSYPNTPEGRQQAAMDVLKESGERIKKQMKEKQEKEDKKEEQKPKKLSEMKKGDTVALVMDRYNPQLGNYVVIQKKQIEGTTSKSFVVDGKKFDKVSGDRRDPSSSVYGSTTYSIMTEQELRKHVKDGKYKGGRISGVNPFEEESE